MDCKDRRKALVRRTPKYIFPPMSTSSSSRGPEGGLSRIGWICQRAFGTKFTLATPEFIAARSPQPRGQNIFATNNRQGRAFMNLVSRGISHVVGHLFLDALLINQLSRVFLQESLGSLSPGSLGQPTPGWPKRLTSRDGSHRSSSLAVDWGRQSSHHCLGSSSPPPWARWGSST